jgi:peptidoglycan/LPS O-acetylase OafA/YrhL
MKRLHFIDSLRGLAALYVVLHHIVAIPSPALAVPKLVHPFIEFGYSGVFLFFVISGFSLTLTMPRHVATGSPLTSYTLSRLFRIAPLFYFMIAVMVCFYWVEFGYRPSSKTIAVNISFIFNMVPHYQDGIVWASWTIGVEMIYYVMFPLILAATTSWKVAITAVSVILFAAIEQLPQARPIIFFIFLGYLPIFLFGEFSFEVFEQLSRRSYARTCGYVLTSAAIAILGISMFAIKSDELIPFRLFSGVGYSFLLIGLGLAPLSAIVNRVTSFLGKISYSIYLCHAIIIWHLVPVYRVIDGHLTQAIALLACIALTLATVLPIAYLSFTFIEQPAIKLGRAVLRRRLQAVPA